MIFSRMLLVEMTTASWAALQLSWQCMHMAGEKSLAPTAAKHDIFRMLCCSPSPGNTTKPPFACSIKTQRGICISKPTHLDLVLQDLGVALADEADVAQRDVLHLRLLAE